MKKKALKKLLYVEDDEDIAELTQTIITDICGLEVKHCANGKVALETYPLYQPDMILVDVMMPVMDGTTMVKIFKENPENPDIPIVFLTAKAQPHQQKEYMELGAAAVMMKPFGSGDLCQALKEIWEKHCYGN